MTIRGQKGLDSLGCNNPEMLLVAREKYGDKIDATQLLKEDGNEEEMQEKIAA